MKGGGVTEGGRVMKKTVLDERRECFKRTVMEGGTEGYGRMEGGRVPET